jgi:BlaI family transcriptional regulator, penicillinase repressor
MTSKKRAKTGLTRREREIMDIVYQRGQATAAEVRADLPSAPSDSAVRTLLRLLEEKDELTHERVGQRFVYQPTTARSTAGRSALRHLVETFFGGSVETAVATLLDERSQDLSPEALDRLAEKIQNAADSEEA